MNTKLNSKVKTPPLAVSVRSEDPLMGDMIQHYGFVLFPLIHAMVVHEVPQKLESGPKSIQDIVAGTKLRPHKLEVDLDVLTRFGLFHRDDGNRYSNNENTRRILCNPINEPLIRFMGMPEIWATWGKHAEGLTSDASAFALANGGIESMDYFMANPAAAGPFQEMLKGQTILQAQAIVPAYDFSNCQTIVDIGCGHGTLATTILEKYPGPRAILFDTPKMVPLTKRICANSPVAERISFAEGDFFKEVPSGDTLMLKLVLHDWTDEQAHTILANCRKAVQKGAKVLIMEHLRTTEDLCFFDLMNPTMTTIQLGWERVEAGYRQLLKKASFDVTRVIRAAPTGMSIVEAVAS